MKTSKQKNLAFKNLLRSAWRFASSAIVFLNVHNGLKERALKIYYGGARAGDIGGPLVKVKRLKEHFPERRFSFNIVYTLSNTPYLSEQALLHIKRKQIPLILNQNGLFYPGWYDGDWEKNNFVMSKAYHLADHVFWQSEFCRRSANKFLGERRGPGEILYNAIDTKLFHPAGEKSPRKPITFLITGKINEHLNYRLKSTIEALAEARNNGLNARLLISGWVETPHIIKEFAKSLNLDDAIDLSGPYTQEKAPSIYRSADVYVTTKYLDPCPNAVLEAMACGLPVLYSASGGTPELVGKTAGIGLPVPEDWYNIHVPSSHDISSGMIRIASSFSEMGACARKRAVEKFDLKDWIERHETVFLSLLEASN